MAKQITTEELINNWNAKFPDYQLTVEELKKPLSVMGALFQLFDRIGIDQDAVLMPPPEKNLNEHCPYYWDLIPVFNITRVINHLVSVLPHFTTISIDHFLQPTVMTSHSILLLLFNLMLFHEDRLMAIAPYEEQLFEIAEMAKVLEAKKHKLFEMVNSQTVEKGKRAVRMDQMAEEISQLEQEIQAEELARDKEKQELDKMIKENNATDALLDQKRATKEGLLAERDRKRNLRVYDADDISGQAVQSKLKLQEAEEKLTSLQQVMAEKENSLKILQMIKPNLDTANNMLHDITKLKDQDMGNLDEDSMEGELEVLNTELLELRAHETDLSTRRAEAARTRQERHAKRQQEKTLTESAVRNAEDNDQKRRESAALATQRSQEIQQLTAKYAEQRGQGVQCIQGIKQNYQDSLRAWEDAVMKLVTDLKADIERKENSDEDGDR